MSFIDNLNSEQRQAVTHKEGPLLVLAGAGSGKTRVLTYRMAYLMKNARVNPRNILAITFTNKAAREMKDRINLLMPETKSLLVSTFHSACVRFLRMDIDKLGYNRNFIIFDNHDQQVVIKDCLKTLNIDDKRYSPSAVLRFIGGAKDTLLTPKKCADQAKDIRETTMAQLYELYQKRLRDSNAMDFDDLIMNTALLFKQNPEVLSYYQNRFKYILVDEYQDTNLAQYELIKMMAEEHRNLCVVGDDDQSIYSFRGADIRNILEFEVDFPDATVIRLEQNYRSTQSILDAANSVIDHNFGRKKKKLWTENGEGEKISLATLENEYEEAQYISREIERLIVEKGCSYGDFAVLYRTNAQSRVIEEIMVRAGLPYKIVGGLKFYQRKEIKDILSYLRIVANPSDNVSLERVINVPRRGIGKTTLENLKEVAASENVSMYDIISNVDMSPLTSAAKNKLNKFYVLIEGLREASKKMAISDLMEYILQETGYHASLASESTPDAISRLENLQEMVGAAKEFERRSPDVGLEDFLSELALVADIDDVEEEEQAIILMTLHSAKGLEYPVVFLAGLDEGIFPHSRSMLDDDQLEEERRLCYVGMTRAREKLYLTRAWQRSIYGNTSYYTASRFLDEIPQELLEEVSFNEKKEQPRRSSYCDDFAPSYSASYSRTLTPGDRVSHSKWGEGIVVDIDGMDEDAEVSISFPEIGVKHLILKYAPIVKL